jgi:hypothetical protein
MNDLVLRRRVAMLAIADVLSITGRPLQPPQSRMRRTLWPSRR